MADRSQPSGWYLGAAVAILVLIVAVDAALGAKAVLIGALSLGSLVASLGATTRQTAAVAVGRGCGGRAGKG